MLMLGGHLAHTHVHPTDPAGRQLLPPTLRRLPTGATKPAGWLKHELELQVSNNLSKRWWPFKFWVYLLSTRCPLAPLLFALPSHSLARALLGRGRDNQNLCWHQHTFPLIFFLIQFHITRYYAVILAIQNLLTGTPIMY